MFAGAELRDRLSLGENREDILAGLHRAIILRAMSIISRSGGITDEFTFTGGVAKNEAAVRELRKLVQENYGDVDYQYRPQFHLYRRAWRRRIRPPRRRTGVEGRSSMTLAAGIDVGTGAIKAAVFEVTDGETKWLGRETIRLRQRDPIELAGEAYDAAFEGSRSNARRHQLLRHDRRGRERAISHRPLLFHDHPCPRCHLSRSGRHRGA